MGLEVVDVIWVMLSAALVFLMQAGFLCLESGLTRSKNNINVAIKNLTDFGVTTALFWVFGFAIMFGATAGGLWGTDQFFPDYGNSERVLGFLLFQLMFCGTAVTIMSGAIAERVRFSSYIILTIIVAGLVYPFFGHWAWNGLNVGQRVGLLGERGFVDFAGASVVHSVGGWASLAILLIIGARRGRFNVDGSVNKITGANLPLAALGVILLWFGWFGFNGGSVLAIATVEGATVQPADTAVRVLTNTIVAGSFGMIAALAVGWPQRGRADVDLVINGALAGLVAITANAHAIALWQAVVIGALGGVIMFGVDTLLKRLRLDDAVGVIPVHLGAGVWGTLAVGLFGDPRLLGTGLSRVDQIGVQVTGIVVCGLWTFGIVYVLGRVINTVHPLRVDEESERIGLNVSEHGATTDLLDLFAIMAQQEQTGDLSLRAPVEPFTEVGQIAARYNQVMDALQVAVEQTEGIIRSAMDGIITFSAHSLNILTFNPAAELLFGYAAAEVRGQPLTYYLTGPNKIRLDAAELDQLFYMAAMSENHLELYAERADGQAVPLEVAVAEMRAGDQPIYTAVLRDITDRKQYEAELVNARQMAEEASRAKSTFLANMSHELRTPLNAIIGYGDMLMARVYGDLNDKQTDRISRIIQSGRLLLEHINSVLDLSKIEAGRMETYLEFFRVEKVLETVLETVRPQADKNGNHIVEDYEQPAGVLHTDYTKLQQILMNLMSNAAKFTENGTITLRFYREQAADQEWAVFQVADTGIGMSAAQLNRVFAEFTQADSSTTRKYGGTGLGLALSKRFAELLGGRITAQSEPGAGSTFTLRLPAAIHRRPLAPAPQPEDAASTPEQEQPVPANSVLVIDDDATVRELMTHYLEQENYTVYTAADGEEGLRLAKEINPALITLDVMMPNMDGWQVLTRLKEDADLTRIPVIMLTITDDRGTGIALGAADFVSKPIEKERVLSAINQYRCATQPCPVLVVDDDEDMRNVLADILTAEGWQVTGAENGQVALERLAQERPVVILLDLMMPVMDGFEFLEKFQRQPDYRDIPVVVITARNLTPDERDILKGGVQRVLQKGEYKTDELLQSVRMLANQFISRRSQR